MHRMTGWGLETSTSKGQWEDTHGRVDHGVRGHTAAAHGDCIRAVNEGISRGSSPSLGSQPGAVGTSKGEDTRIGSFSQGSCLTTRAAHSQPQPGGSGMAAVPFRSLSCEGHLPEECCVSFRVSRAARWMNPQTHTLAQGLLLGVSPDYSVGHLS